MAWTTPRTWVTGETVTAAMMNEQVRDNGNYLKTFLDYGYPLKTITTEVETVNSTAVTNLISYTVPANTLGSANILLVRLMVSVLSNWGTLTTTNYDFKYGGTSLGGGLIVWHHPYATRYAYEVRCWLKGNGATNSQRGMIEAIQPLSIRDTASYYEINVGVEGTAAIDSTAAQVLLVTATNGAANANYSTIMRMATIDYRALL